MSSADGPGSEQDLDELALERVAAHFDGATITDGLVHTGLAGITIACRVEQVQEMGPSFAASLYFVLAGPPLGGSPVFASISGYHDTPPAAVVEGVCMWTCSIRPLLRAAVGLPMEESGRDDVETFAVEIDGRPFDVFAQGLDRVMSSAGEGEVRERLVTARSRQPDRSMTASVLRSSQLPALAGNHSYVLSTFVMQVRDQQTTEVKVQGGDWPPVWASLAASGPEPEGAATLMREIAVLVPRAPGALTREAVERTLALLTTERSATAGAAGWRGWAHHDGHLGPVLGPDEIADVEQRCGPLSPAHRRFLTEVAGSGAGPGYGLLAPRRTPDGILLAEAGCGSVWLAREDGSVWADARGTDDSFARVFDDVEEWYVAWLDHAVGGQGPWQTWDWVACACVNILTQVIEKNGDLPAGAALAEQAPMGVGSLRISDAEGRLMAPSHACIEAWSRFGFDDAIWASGDADAPPPATPAVASDVAPTERRSRWRRRRG